MNFAWKMYVLVIVFCNLWLSGEIVESIFVQTAKLLYQDYAKYKIGNPLINKTKVDDIKLKKGKDSTAKKKCC